MSLALLRKELHEHGVVLVAMLILGAIALYGLLLQGDEQGGRFIALTRFTMLFGVLLALVVANRLLVREYAGRTQLFLETLPIARARVFATKWLTGCALLLLIACGAWLASLQWIRRTEVLSWSDATGPLLAVLAFSLAIWSFAAMAAMLGRYRYVAWIALAVTMLGANVIAGTTLMDFPLLRLLGSHVAMARALPDLLAFVQAGAVVVLCTSGAVALALSGSGAMASALSQRMTARERVFVIVALLAALTLLSTLQPKPVRPPFEIASGERVQGKYADVGVLPTADVSAADAQALAATLAQDVDSLIEALHLDARASVFILPQQGLDRSAMQRAALGGEDGIVLKVAPNAPRDAVRALTLHSLLGDATLGRGLKEDRHVLLDGLAAYWALRNDPAAREVWWLRAAAHEPALDAAALTQWSVTSERVGECLSQAIAFDVFAALVEHSGLQSSLALMQRLLAIPPDNFRVLFEPSPSALLAELQLDWERLAALAEHARQRARERHAAALARRPEVESTVRWRRAASTGTTIEAALTGVDRYAVFYTPLDPWTADVGDMSRLDVRGAEAVLPISPQAGARYLTAIEIDDPVLDCPVRVLAERIELP